MTNVRSIASTVLMTLGLLAVAPLGVSAADQRPENVFKVIKANKDLSKFADLVSSSGAESDFTNKEAKLTVFAPNNAAMESIPSDVLKKAKTEKDGLKSLVQYHTISGSIVFSGNIKGRRASPSSTNGEMIGFDGMGKELKVGNAIIVTPDLNAQNGVVHVINAPLIPLSLDDKTVQKQKEAQEAEQKKMEEQMKEREAKMEAERAKKEAEEAKNAPKKKETAPVAAKEGEKVETPVAPSTEAVKAPTAPTAPTAPSAATPKKDEPKSDWKKLFGF